MALSDPQSVTIDGTAFSLPLISRQDGVAKYVSADQTVSETVRQDATSATKRSSFAFQASYLVTDPVTGLVTRKQTNVSILITRPVVGRAIADDVKLVLGACAYASASSGAVVTRILSGES